MNISARYFNHSCTYAEGGGLCFIGLGCGSGETPASLKPLSGCIEGPTSDLQDLLKNTVKRRQAAPFILVI